VCVCVCVCVRACVRARACARAESMQTLARLCVLGHVWPLQERLTLKHRNTSRWARRALKRGATLHDPGTKAAIAEQMRLGQALKRKIEGGRGSDSEGSTDASTR